MNEGTVNMKAEDFRRFARKGHNACNGGTGVVGQDTKTGRFIPCDCVMRNLRRQFRANVMKVGQDVVMPKVEIIYYFKKRHDRFIRRRDFFRFFRLKTLAGRAAYQAMIYKTAITIIDSTMVKPK